jgi:hypothetical protein
MKSNIELINRVAEYGSCFNGLWHGTIMETDVALWPGLPVPNDSNQLFPGFCGLLSSIIRHPATCCSFPKRVACTAGDNELDIPPPWLRFSSNQLVKITVWVYNVLKPVYILRTTMSVLLYVKTVIVHCFHTLILCHRSSEWNFLRINF